MEKAVEVFEPTDPATLELFNLCWLHLQKFGPVTPARFAAACVELGQAAVFFLKRSEAPADSSNEQVAGEIVPEARELAIAAIAFAEWAAARNLAALTAGAVALAKVAANFKQPEELAEMGEMHEAKALLSRLATGPGSKPKGDRHGNQT